MNCPSYSPADSHIYSNRSDVFKASFMNTCESSFQSWTWKQVFSSYFKNARRRSRSSGLLSLSDPAATKQRTILQIHHSVHCNHACFTLHCICSTHNAPASANNSPRVCSENTTERPVSPSRC